MVSSKTGNKQSECTFVMIEIERTKSNLVVPRTYVDETITIKTVEEIKLI